MKKIIFFTLALISPTIFATQSSIFKITALTAAEHKEIKETCEQTGCDFNFLKTDKGLLAFSIHEPIVQAKIGQCIQIFHTSDKIETNNVNYGIVDSEIVNCSLKNQTKTIPNINILHTENLDHEAVGLKVIDFIFNNKEYSYRIYCPNHTVRNISNNKVGKLRTAIEEDKLTFSGKSVLRQLAEKICD
ncbi:hypothetical protein QMO40_00540 [Mannheimia bovis]|uniref:hypothetical protein n=1 Tax=Mannheimia bovis TaxID=2770636 RepID=UPI0024B70D7A|nr:hypothetical protein [Mannheimia bovis]WHP47201.1 hypothetical protein QMO40_00540 [Mannheimia bovis]